MQRLVLGDSLWIERQALRARWSLIFVVAIGTAFLPLDDGQRMGLYGVLLAASVLYVFIQLWAIPRWTRIRTIGLVSVSGDAVLLVAAIALSGGLRSPIWGVAYLFTTTVAIRYGTRATLGAAVLLASLYAAVVFPGADPAEVGPEFAIRISFFLGTSAFAGVLAEQAWAAHRRLSEQLRRSELHLAANAAIEPSVDARQIIERSTDAGLKLLDGAICAVVTERHGEPAWSVAPGVVGELAAIFAVALAEIDQTPETQIGVHELPVDSAARRQLGPILVAPLLGHAGPMGRLSVARRSNDDKFDAIDTEAFEALAERTGLAMDIADLYAELSNQLLEVELAQAREMQAAKLAGIGELSANVAHELNNPLTGVLMHLGLISEAEGLPEDVHASAQVIQDEVLRMRGIVRSLLDFARQSQAETAEQDVAELIRTSVGLVTSWRGAGGIDIDWHVADPPPRAVLDADQFKQVFVNLVGNAFDVMGEDGRLTLRVEGDDRWVHIEVEDTGPGIPADTIERIFEPFFTTKPRGVGTGLGLSVSHGIVSKHGGTITVQSAVGEGATFVIRIPAQAPRLQRIGDA